jgi:aryl-alcohol dehydrogenase-like predicted oxidoreductase
VEYRELGRTGIDVSRVILGCGNFGGVGSSHAFIGRGETEAEAFALMDAAWAAGITTFDTADAYGGGRSESYIGAWLREQRLDVRQRIVLSTKTFNPMSVGADSGLSRARIMRQIDTSLERLGVDRIDLYLAHDQDASTPVDETLGAMNALVKLGMVRAFGASNIDAAGLEEALDVSERRGLRRFDWVQNSYSLLDRADERGVLELCRRAGLGYTPFGPLAGGWLTGKYRRGEEPPAGSRMTLRPEPYRHLEDDRVYDALDAFRKLAAERGTTQTALALAWVLAQPTVTAIVVGPRRPEQLQPALEALALKLSPVEAETIGQLFA